jgi:hypothetical protein
MGRADKGIILTTGTFTLYHFASQIVHKWREQDSDSLLERR